MIIDLNLLLDAGACIKDVKAGEIIFREGADAHFYHQVVSGSVRWVNINDEGREVIQAMVGAGECFGEMPLFDDLPFAATAVADEDSTIIRLHKHSFKQLISQHPDIHFAFTRLLSERIRFKFMMLAELCGSDPEHKLVFLLDYFKQNNKNVCPKCHKLKLTRQHLANMTGLRVETVIRTIKQLEQKGQLEIDKGKVFFR